MSAVTFASHTHDVVWNVKFRVFGPVVVAIDKHPCAQECDFRIIRRAPPDKDLMHTAYYRMRYVASGAEEDDGMGGAGGDAPTFARERLLFLNTGRHAAECDVGGLCMRRRCAYLASLLHVVQDFSVRACSSSETNSIRIWVFRWSFATPSKRNALPKQPLRLSRRPLSARSRLGTSRCDQECDRCSARRTRRSPSCAQRRRSRASRTARSRASRGTSSFFSKRNVPFVLGKPLG